MCISLRSCDDMVRFVVWWCFARDMVRSQCEMHLVPTESTRRCLYYVGVWGVGWLDDFSRFCSLLSVNPHSLIR